MATESDLDWFACNDAGKWLRGLARFVSKGAGRPSWKRSFGLAGLAIARLTGALPDDDELSPDLARVLWENAAGVPADHDTIRLLKRGQGAVELPSDHVSQIGRFSAWLEGLWLANGGKADWKSLAAALSSFASPLGADQQEEACDVLRCIFGGLVRPISLEPSWLKANNSAADLLAQEVYARDQFDLMPVLGDALEDAGCADDAVLEHCRSVRPHAAGCWVIAAIRGEPTWSDSRRFGVAVNNYSLRLYCNGNDQHSLGERGFAYSKMGRYDELIEDMNVLLAANPTSAWALRMRGFGHQEKEEFESAMADFHRAIELAPNDPWTHAHLGYVFNRLGRVDQALASLNRAIELDPLDAWARSKRASAYAKKGDHARAIDDFTSALENGSRALTESDRAWALARRGRAYLLSHQPEKAVEDLTHALEAPVFATNPDFHWACRQRAVAHLKLGDFGQARADFERALQDKAGLNSYAWHLATSPHDAFRDGKRAIELATRACELSAWKDADCLDTLAAAHAEAGDFDQAVGIQEQAIALGTLDDDALRQLDLFRARRPYRTS
jgi:tetratricopeptide (TPR) repeat protein